MFPYKKKWFCVYTIILLCLIFINFNFEKMQSHLEAALLGHGNSTNVSGPVEDDDKDEHFEDNEDIDEFIDEECDGESTNRTGKTNIWNSSSSKTVTLQMLLGAGILTPGSGTMSIEYLGQKFVGDLLEDGKIRSQETDIVFASPSAWAIACKRFINPDKKSGCGWASVKYRGKKLDAYKNVWYKKKKEEQLLNREGNLAQIFDFESLDLTMTMAHLPRVVVKHNTIANRTFTHDANTLVECVPFSNLGKIQPFLVSLSTNVALLMDFHCHLTKSEVSGYLAGHWDVNTHNLQITHAFPCRNTKADRENASQVETEISKTIDREKLTLIGWYHSHPFLPCAPTLRDIDAQLDYQIRMKGVSDNSYTPCIGFIISPYNYENSSLEILSNIIAYWVIPPPESKPNEYGRPMLMSYSVAQDSLVSSQVKNEIKKCVDYYKKEIDFINFTEQYNNASTYIDKLRTTLISKFPRDENENMLWTYIRETLGYPSDGKESLLSIPTISKNSLLPSLNPSSSLASNLMLPTDIASVLFNSGKFPSATSLLGLPDPMAHSTLAANNMFLSTNLFKMQELLKPLSTSSPLPATKSKADKINTPLKIPIEHKSPKIDFPTDINILNLKHKIDYNNFDLHLNKSSSKSDFSASDISISSTKHSKQEFSASDLSISRIKTPKLDLNLDLNRKESDIADISFSLPKTDFSMLDLSVSSSNRNLSDPFQHISGDLSVSSANDFSANLTQGVCDQPMNLASE